MYYKISDNLSEMTSYEDSGVPIVGIFTSDESEKKLKDEGIDPKIVIRHKDTNYCKAIVYPDVISGTFSVPSKNTRRQKSNFSYIIRKNNMIFIDDTGIVLSCINRIQKTKIWKKSSLGRFIYDFLETLIESDLRYSEEMGDRLSRMEASVINGNLDNFNHRMTPFRKEVLTFYRYYSQLADIGQELQENENGFFSDYDISLFRMFSTRVEQLQNEVQILRDYSMQVREVYQTQLDLKQNKIMKVLTIVTTIFTPITFIAGWYGMNFENMKELQWEYGYLSVSIISVIVSIVSLWILKKKKFF